MKFTKEEEKKTSNQKSSMKLLQWDTGETKLDWKRDDNLHQMMVEVNIFKMRSLLNGVFVLDVSVLYVFHVFDVWWSLSYVNYVGCRLKIFFPFRKIIA